jgi:hypothetical protein
MDELVSIVDVLYPDLTSRHRSSLSGLGPTYFSVENCVSCLFVAKLLDRILLRLLVETFDVLDLSQGI